MASSVDPASVVTVGVAFREKCRDNVVIPSDCVCDYDEIAEVASSAELLVIILPVRHLWRNIRNVKYYLVWCRAVPDRYGQVVC